tara:strand:- start:2 stop:643 length:642 start_codon:yes stop_codon:yes gene_type:complete
MYKALGVRDVDAILKPVQEGEPTPKDPAIENSESLENLPLVAFEGQNHDAHIMAHLVFGSSGMVQQMPSSVMTLQKHVMEHVSIKAKEQVAAQLQQQSPNAEPTQEELIQIESMVAELISQGMQEVKAVSVQISGGGGEQDPLIGLKSKDLELREKRDQNDVMIDSQKLALEKEKTSLNAQLGQDRIQSTEEIAEARMAAAKEREAMRQSQQR